MSAPIFRDPIQDGAADPVVVRKEGTGEYWMFYTNRRAQMDEPGFGWIHGSPIGIAVSSDGGASWHYRGTVKGLDAPGDDGLNTHWAPEIIWAEGQYHMFLSYITGTPTHWKVPRTITHFTSPDLENWTRVGPLKLSSGNCIDACVFKSPDGLWRMWYKDEGQGSSTWSATSTDLMDWTLEGLVLPGSPDAPPHEGPNVFELGGYYWLITDEWRGQAAYRSDDTINWTRQGLIGTEPGSDPMDKKFVRHADVVVNGDHAAIYYFTHCLWDEVSQAAGPPDIAARATAIHHARLTVVDGKLVFERDVPADLALLA
ncbi:Glycosyl hydrolases family 43 [Devosia equisanguinis]|uniref:Glycosyl hydrolases family 43 n=1 Tax=Devosia equisanguinis TaxID=2490941 RepID=A0A3S4GI73_9HYPH|nr:family 43 glycosylhydrolase [Devosia equisanguinis]VDS05147.1 Glycosyl hydrolases family 43 [Devosia equisanguinis]